MNEDTRDLKKRLRAAQENIDVDKLAAEFGPALQQARAEYDTAVARADAARADLLKRANAAGLSYYRISQLTRVGGVDTGYGQEFIRKVCQADDRPAGSDPAGPVVE